MAEANVVRVPDDMKNGIRKRPEMTRSRRMCSVSPSNGRPPHTSTYSTTPRLCTQQQILQRDRLTNQRSRLKRRKCENTTKTPNTAEGTGISQLQRRCSCHRLSWRRAYRPLAKPAPTGWPMTIDQSAVCNLYAILMVSTPVIHVIKWITTHLPTPDGWKAELAWLVNPQRTPYATSCHMSTTDQCKSASQRPTS